MMAMIVLFMSVLVDYARIVAFHQKLQIDTASGLRSAMSAFDGPLQQRYGLFAGGGTDRTKLFVEAVDGEQSAHVNVDETLGTYAVFRRQVLEEMKYKAPIDFTVELLSTLTSMQSLLENNPATMDVLQQVSKLHDRREQLLDQVLQLQTELAGIAADSFASLASLSAEEVINNEDILLQLQPLAQTTLTTHQQFQQTMQQKLQRAKQLNEQMETIIQQATQNKASNATSLQQLALTDGWFVQYNQQLEQQTTQYASFKTECSHNNVAMLLLAAKEYDQTYGTSGTVIAYYIDEQKSRATNESARKQYQAKAAADWGQLRQTFHDLTSGFHYEEHKKQFEQLQTRYLASLKNNGIAATDNERVAVDLPADVSSAGEQAVGQMPTLLTQLKDIGTHVRDDLYMNEFVASRFSHFHPQQLQALQSQKDPSQLAQLLSLSNQEQEYILYGWDSPSANIVASLSEWIAFRLAIRTSEGLIEYGDKGHPLVVLAAALAYAAEKTLEDFQTLLRTGSAPLSKYAPVQLSYANYLRILMLLHPSDERRVARTIAVIEQNVGYTLAYRPTALTVDMTARMQLWFLPDMFAGLTKIGMLSGKVVDRHYYETSKTMGLSYN